MGDLIQLLLDRPVEGRMPVAMEIDPDGGSAVEILLPCLVNQVRPFSLLDNERLLLFPLLHLGEGMPEVSVIPIDQLLCGRLWCHRLLSEAVGEARCGVYEGAFALTTLGPVTIMNRFYWEMS